MAELIPAAVEAALAAFRTGLYSLRLQQDIEPLPADAFQSWSSIVSLTESKAMEILQRFDAQAVCDIFNNFQCKADYYTCTGDLDNVKRIHLSL